MKEHVESVAIIPARGGSKRIPQKNIKPFAGKPLISYSINAARESGLFKHIVLSTDSDDIAAVGRAHGAEVPFRRPPELSDDHATTDEVLTHAIEWCRSQWATLRYACCIYATAPFIRPQDLRRGLDLLRGKKAITAFSVTSFPCTIFRALKINEDGWVEMFWPENRRVRSQDLPEAYHDAGQFYWVDIEKYLVEPRVFSSQSVPVVLPRALVQDIDTPEDWETAEAMHRALCAGGERRT